MFNKHSSTFSADEDAHEVVSLVSLLSELHSIRLILSVKLNYFHHST